MDVEGLMKHRGPEPVVARSPTSGQANGVSPSHPSPAEPPATRARSCEPPGGTIGGAT